MKYPDITRVNDVIIGASQLQTQLPNGKWVPARPLGFASFSHRCRAAWLVFTGKADALLWEGQ